MNPSGAAPPLGPAHFTALEVPPPELVGLAARAGYASVGLLVDALHLSRTGGSPRDLAGVPPGRLVSAQLCDAPAARPATEEAIIAEARSGWLPPGEGGLPLPELLAAPPDGVAPSLEVPTAGGAPPEARVRRVHEATRRLLERSRPGGGGA